MNSVKIYDALLASRHSTDRRRLLFFSLSTASVVMMSLTGHVLYEYNHLSSDKFSLNRDRGYPEIVQYILSAIAAAAFAITTYARKQTAYLTMAAVMAYLLVDDSLTIHENVGRYLAMRYTLITPFGMDAAHVAESLYLTAIGCTFLFLLIIAFMNTKSKTRIDIAVFTALLMTAAAFGILGDVAHAIIGNKPAAMIEDGGELIGVALLSIFAVDRAAASMRIRAAGNEHTT